MAVKHAYRVVIVGGGLGGLTLGAILHRLGIPFVVLERFERITPQGAAISLAPNALHLLDQLGLYATIQAQGQALRTIDVYRNTTRWGSVEFGQAERYYGYPVYSIERHNFHHLLLEACGTENVKLGAEVIGVEQDSLGVRAYLKNGDSYHGEVLVGADGIRSKVRRILGALHGKAKSSDEMESTIKFTGRVHFSGYTSPLKHLTSADIGVGHWIFLDNHETLTTWPCKSNRQWFIGVQPAPPGTSPTRSIWSDCSVDTLSSRLGGHPHPFGKDGRFQNVLDHSERVVASNVFSETRFPDMSNGRIALLGDSGHSITSFFGQGACQAIEDAAELANALHISLILQTSSVSSALHVYSETRKPRAKDVFAFSNNYARMHTAHLPWGTGEWVRYLIYAWLPMWVWMVYLRWLWGYQPYVKALDRHTQASSRVFSNVFK